MRSRAWSFFAICACVAALAGCGASASSGQTSAHAAAGSPGQPPATPVKPVTNDYHGVSVADPYQWLEHGDDPAVRAWSQAQDRHARRVLDSLPNAGAIRARLTEVMTAPVVYHGRLAPRGDKLFAIKYQPPRQQSFLVVMDGLAPDSARVLVDPNQLDPAGTTSIDWYLPSPDGSLVAVSLSRGGTERGDVSVYDVATGSQVHEVVPHVNGGTAGGDLVWAADGKGFFYTRYPRGDERPPEDHDFFQQVYFHALGTPPEQDRYELGKDFPRIAEIQLDLDRRTGSLLATVQNGDGGEFAHYLRAPDGTWRQISRFGDRIVQVAFGSGDDLYAVSRKDAPRGKILRASIAAPGFEQAQVVVPQGDDNIVTDFWSAPTVLPTRARLYVTYQLGGPSTVRAFDLTGQPAPAPELPPVSAVHGLTRLGEGDDILFFSTTFVEPPAWYRFDAAAGATQKTALATESPVHIEGVQVVREFATSKDGTRVPLNILLPPGATRDGKNPVVVTGYGGYGVSLQPRFRATDALLLEQGVVYVIANLRGGGEYGETWHEQGRLTAKQNVFDDFAAVLQHLIERDYTRPERIGIIGGSNGGLLMGATLVQHPALVAAVVSYVGIYDSLRTELSPNGAFNVTEYGTVKDPAQFRALRAYSPYHNVADQVAYPATLLLTGENDPRVEPWHSRKMAARLQAATTSDAPVLLRISADTGHGAGTSLDEAIAQLVHVHAFLLHRLGVDHRPAEE